MHKFDSEHLIEYTVNRQSLPTSLLRKAVPCGVLNKIKEQHLSLSTMDVVKDDDSINSSYT
jgi:hypothetical protein